MSMKIQNASARLSTLTKAAVAAGTACRRPARWPPRQPAAPAPRPPPPPPARELVCGEALGVFIRHQSPSATAPDALASDARCLCLAACMRSKIFLTHV